eukprot:7014104-Lingulodinium_polyedra.AAC.1
MRLQRPGSRTTPSAPYCREAKDDLRHRWWRCPAFEHIRDRDSALDDLVAECPPPDCLLPHGICPALGADTEGPLWADFPDQRPAEVSVYVGLAWAERLGAYAAEHL